MALVIAFLAAENESRQLEDLPQADFGSVPERILLSVKDQCNNWQLCQLKIRPIAWSYSDSRHVFILSAHGFANFIQRLSILLFSFFNKDRSQCLRHFKKSVGEKKSIKTSSRLTQAMVLRPIALWQSPKKPPTGRLPFWRNHTSF